MLACWIVALLGFAYWSTRTFGLLRHWARRPHLSALPAGGEGLPRLSVVVPALDEEATIEGAMRSLLEVDYPGLEVIAVDDRSTDRTGVLLDDFAALDSRLRVLHVKELPAGWLGKNHAMHHAARQARGQWILFTDADIHFEASALRRAVAFAESSGLDHLVVLPECVVTGFREKLFQGFFWVLFACKLRPWKVRDPKSRAHIGVGAFNMVRADFYRRAGGHAAMPMEILDDVKLGKLLKQRGARQDCVAAGALVRVRWVEGVGGAVRGLTKNLFAALHYSVLRSVAGSLLLLAGVAWPAVGLFVGPAGARLLCAGTLACMVLAIRAATQTPGLSRLYGLGFPIAAVVFVYIVARSTIHTLRQGGVVWRGTLYPLAELRRGVV